MTSTLTHSTSSADRCEAQNKLTCRVHGVAGSFTTVPAVVVDNVDRLRSLREQTADAKVALHQQAVDMGIRVADIGHITHIRERAAEYRAADVDALTNLEGEYQEALGEEEDEQDWQGGQVENFLHAQIKQDFPTANATERDAIARLTGLRFFGEEAELGEPDSAEFKAAWVADQTSLFAPLANFETRAKLRELDRAYFTALSGRIPTDQQLDDVDELRQLRVKRIPTSADLDRTFALSADLAAID